MFFSRQKTAPKELRNKAFNFKEDDNSFQKDSVLTG